MAKYSVKGAAAWRNTADVELICIRLYSKHLDELLLLCLCQESRSLRGFHPYFQNKEVFGGILNFDLEVIFSLACAIQKRNTNDFFTTETSADEK
jgi:hypothetical protein